MKKKIYYWGPFIDKVATIKAILNSARYINEYSENYSATIINAVGEWKSLKEDLMGVNLIDLNLNFYNSLPKFTFLKSRFSYLKIFLKCFFPLKNLLKKENPDYLIIHLIVPLPLILFLLFKFKTKLCLRVSGKPKLNLFRKFLWKISSKKIHKVFCPTLETKYNLINQKIFNKNVFVLEDPILESQKINLLTKKNLPDDFKKDQMILIGRLTKQKNFRLFIEAFSLIEKKYPNIKANIIGYGELRESLENLIIEKKLEKKIFLLGYKSNVFKYLKSSKFFILSSLWEDPGFVLIEAAYCNTTIISSDCPSGPKEFLLNGKAGFLFKSNSLNDLANKMENALKSSEQEIFMKKRNAKLQSLKYSAIRHSKKLEKFLSF